MVSTDIDMTGGFLPMFHRALLALLAAILLSLAPSTAFALDYDENDGDGVTSDNPNPAPGEVFGVSVESDDCGVVRLRVDSPRSETTIDGKQTNSRTKPGDADGTTDFSVSIGVEGEFELTGVCVPNGEVLGVEMVVVGDGEAARTTTADARQAGLLPDTGAQTSTTALTVGGGLLVLAGAATLLIRRRKGDAG